MRKKDSRYRHGHACMGWNRKGSPEYRAWLGMRSRCLNAKGKSFLYWGGRGIKICERWNTFENFLADMGKKPNGTSLDRINNDGNYEPGNCRWATAIEQSRNRRMENTGRDPIDLSGKQFFRLTAISLIENKRSYGTKWLCKCACGNTAEILAGNLTKGHSKSCGCYKSEVLRKPRVFSCSRGHPYDEENTKIWNGSRCCRECSRAANRAYRARKRELRK